MTSTWWIDMNSEADVKKRVKRVLKDLGAWYYMPVPTGYGKQGVPDFLVCLDGLFVAIETKYGGNKLTAYQQVQFEQISEAEGLTLEINEKNVGNLSHVLVSWVYEKAAAFERDL